MRRKLAAGNWKMHGDAGSLNQIADLVVSHAGTGVDVLICPPATLLSRATSVTAGSGVKLGGQDCHAEPSGAHTGDLSANMLSDAGATFVILGHSERRAGHGETDKDVCVKAIAARDAGLVAIICVGETRNERETGQTLSVISDQLAGSVPDGATAEQVVIAYEPVWAIGTGLTPTTDQIAEVHAHIRATLSQRFGTEIADATRLLYGGSVKAGNAADIFAIDHVDGALVGGASLTSADFSPIVAALDAA